MNHFVCFHMVTKIKINIKFEAKDVLTEKLIDLDPYENVLFTLVKYIIQTHRTSEQNFIS